MDAARSQPNDPHQSNADRMREALDAFRVQVQSALTVGGKVKCFIDTDGNGAVQSIRADVTSDEGLLALAAQLVSDHQLNTEKRDLAKAGDGDLFLDEEFRLLLATPKLYTWVMDAGVLELEAAIGDQDAKRKLKNLKRRYPRIITCNVDEDTNDREGDQ